MTKEKLQSLTKYAEQLKSKLTDPLPIKHTHRHEQFRQFLKNELATVTKTLNDAKLEGIK